MEAKELLNKWVEEIDKPLIKNKVKFTLLGVRGEFETIRSIIGLNEPEAAKIDGLKDICESRIDRLKSFSSDLMTFISVAVATFTVSLSIMFDLIMKQEPSGNYYCWLPERLRSILNESFGGACWFVSKQEPDWIGIKILLIALLILIILCTLQFWRFRAQANAWYAIKEGLLLLKQEQPKHNEVA